MCVEDAAFCDIYITQKQKKKNNESKAKANFISCLFLLVLVGGTPTCSPLPPFCCVQSFLVKIYLWACFVFCFFFIKIEGRLQKLSRQSWSFFSLRKTRMHTRPHMHTHKHTHTYMHWSSFVPIAYVNIYKEKSLKVIKQICA